MCIHNTAETICGHPVASFDDRRQEKSGRELVNVCIPTRCTSVVVLAQHRAPPTEGLIDAFRKDSSSRSQEQQQQQGSSHARIHADLLTHLHLAAAHARHPAVVGALLCRLVHEACSWALQHDLVKHRHVVIKALGPQAVGDKEGGDEWLWAGAISRQSITSFFVYELATSRGWELPGRGPQSVDEDPARAQPRQIQVLEERGEEETYRESETENGDPDAQSLGDLHPSWDAINARKAAGDSTKGRHAVDSSARPSQQRGRTGVLETDSRLRSGSRLRSPLVGRPSTKQPGHGVQGGSANQQSLQKHGAREGHIDDGGTSSTAAALGPVMKAPGGPLGGMPAELGVGEVKNEGLSGVFGSGVVLNFGGRDAGSSHRRGEGLNRLLSSGLDFNIGGSHGDGSPGRQAATMSSWPQHQSSFSTWHSDHGRDEVHGDYQGYYHGDSHSDSHGDSHIYNAQQPPSLLPAGGSGNREGRTRHEEERKKKQTQKGSRGSASSSSSSKDKRVKSVKKVKTVAFTGEQTHDHDHHQQQQQQQQQHQFSAPFHFGEGPGNFEHGFGGSSAQPRLSLPSSSTHYNVSYEAAAPASYRMTPFSSYVSSAGPMRTPPNMHPSASYSTSTAPTRGAPDPFTSSAFSTSAELAATAAASRPTASHLPPLQQPIIDNSRHLANIYAHGQTLGSYIYMDSENDKGNTSRGHSKKKMTKKEKEAKEAKDQLLVRGQRALSRRARELLGD
ncbi:hypothetical protein GGR56DRAFT_161267 [Xylariaceae sp. FL0804]|nr:hypothetical protein GGR56DRAFT_161267 [Xylariaceae sp. FL0804]